MAADSAFIPYALGFLLATGLLHASGVGRGLGLGPLCRLAGRSRRAGGDCRRQLDDAHWIVFRRCPVSRIFPPLAIFAILTVAATLILGLSLGDVRDPNDVTTQRWATVHRLSGVAAALVVLGVNSIAVTYFVGTSRWCREVTDAYQLEPSSAPQSKPQTAHVPPGRDQYADPGCHRGLGNRGPSRSIAACRAAAASTWAHVHLVTALAGLVFLAYTSFLEWVNIDANHDVIEAIMGEVRRIREAKGLEV